MWEVGVPNLSFLFVFLILLIRIFIFIRCKISTIRKPHFYRFWLRRALGNDGDPSKQISEIMDMRSISIKNMKWNLGIFGTKKP